MSFAPSARFLGNAEIMPRNRPSFAMGRTARGRAGSAARRRLAERGFDGSDHRSRLEHALEVGAREDEHQAAVAAARLIMRLIVASRTSSPRWFSTSCL